jgi:TRAP-type C4-dicarboxylate transport system substrate-binding protein
MKNKLVLLLVMIILASNAWALTVKIGSVAPLRSPWDDALKEIGRKWKEITRGLVDLRVYAGGIAGSEEDMIRKMRIGTLQGAVLTNIGMVKVCQEAYVFLTPFLFNSEEELNHVLQDLRPGLEKIVSDSGFHTVIWVMSGWINFFSREKAVYPEDLKKQKMSFSSGEPEFEMAWKKMGFQIVPSELRDLMIALQSKRVDAFYLPPVVTASGQYFPFAPYMLSIRVAPLVGGFLISNSTWKKIPEEYHAAMLKAVEDSVARLNTKIADLEREAIATMKKHGLKIQEVTPEIVDKWRLLAQSGMDELVGKMFSREIYGRVMKLLADFRKK